MKISFTVNGGATTVIGDGVSEPCVVASAGGRQAVDIIQYVRATTVTVFPRAAAQESVTFSVTKEYATLTLANQASLSYPAGISRAKGSLSFLNPADNTGVKLNNCVLTDWKLKERLGVQNEYEFTYVGESYTVI
jgi:hypothetical protein